MHAMLPRMLSFTASYSYSGVRTCSQPWARRSCCKILCALPLPGLVDAFTAASYTAAHYDGFWGTLFSCPLAVWLMSVLLSFLPRSSSHANLPRFRDDSQPQPARQAAIQDSESHLGTSSRMCLLCSHHEVQWICCTLGNSRIM